MFQRKRRTSLEDMKEPVTSVQFKGPLSEVYTTALISLLDKNKSEEVMDNIAVETQQMDVDEMEKLAKIAEGVGMVGDTHMTTTVYGVSRDEVTNEVMLDIVDRVNTDDLSANNDFVLVIDETVPGSSTPTEMYVRNITAVEAMCDARGVKVYKSLEAFAKVHCQG